MNSKLATAGGGGAFAVLLAWYIEAHYGIKPSGEQMAAMASALSALFSYTDEILAAIKCLILKFWEKKPDEGGPT